MAADGACELNLTEKANKFEHKFGSNLKDGVNLNGSVT